MQVTRLAKAHRNHPSWYAFSSGNELFRCEGPTPDEKFMDYILYAHKTFKSLDPTRFFIASEGNGHLPYRRHYETERVRRRSQVAVSDLRRID